MQAIDRNQVAEWRFVPEDTPGESGLEFVFTGEDGSEQIVPAFEAPGGVWGVRFAPQSTGRVTFRGRQPGSLEGEFHVTEYEGDNPLYKHGRLRVSDDRRHFQHADGTPFFWLGDTWWMGLCKRLSWPEDFQTLALDRIRKGYSVVQIVAGLYPDMPAFDERGANERGYPWEKDFTRINPAYFEFMDRRIAYLVDQGIVPCIVGCWGYYLRFMGIEKAREHWRNLIARYGAYPVVWCLAGEGTMPYYMSGAKEEDAAFQKSGWTEIARFVHETDPFDNLVTIHPTDKGREQVEDPSVLDFEMLQTGHGDRQSHPNTVDRSVEARSIEPAMPFINSEVCYEGIGGACADQVQRAMFWCCILSGAAGHTYGANGIWQVNRPDEPYGPSPHGMSYGDTPWDVASALPGSTHLSLAKRLLTKYEWWRFEPHPEWVDPHWTPENYQGAYAAGIPGQVRVVYFPFCWWGGALIKGLEPNIRYHAYLFNPMTGQEVDLGHAKPDADGNWDLPVGNAPWKAMPIYQDWVLVMERR